MVYKRRQTATKQKFLEKPQINESSQFYLLNIRGINAVKSVQLFHNVRLNECDVLFLTETHERYQKVEIPKPYSFVSRWRDENDKKGGGLLIVTGNKVKVEKLDSKSSDILFCTLKVNNITVKAVLVYIDIGKQNI